MRKRDTRSALVLAALLAGALALPGLAAADGGRGWGDGGRGDRHGERHSGRGDRDWDERRHHDRYRHRHDHDRGQGYGYREERMERPAHHPAPAGPSLGSGLSVFFNRAW